MRGCISFTGWLVLLLLCECSPGQVSLTGQAVNLVVQAVDRIHERSLRVWLVPLTSPLTSEALELPVGSEARSSQQSSRCRFPRRKRRERPRQLPGGRHTGSQSCG